MNYEELLESKSAAKAVGARMPLGMFSKKLIGEKYQNIVSITPSLNDSIKFAEGLKAESEKNLQLRHKNQLHFEVEQDKKGNAVLLRLEQGNYLTLKQLLNEQPSIVANKSFVDGLIGQLFDVAEYLHGEGIFHVCFAPENILIRKGDNTPLLLNHGSFYLGMSDSTELYQDMESFVAPEVSKGDTVDARCDIYSLGRLMEWLFSLSEMPYEYKRVMKKAVNDEPDKRYNAIADMRKALKVKREFYKSGLTLAAAVVIALLLVGLYFELMPESTNVEFVKPAPRQATDDLLEDGFDPAELGVVSGDTMIMTPEERQSKADYDAKAEQIFRKRFTAEADRVLSKIYNNEYMSSSEKKFLSEMSSVNEELLKLQVELGEEAGLTTSRSQLIATQIVEDLTNQKKKKLQYYGVQK